MGERGNATLQVLCAPVLPHFPGRETQALAVFSSGGGSEMKSRVIYKYIKNECIYEVLFSSHSPLAIVATLYPSVFAYKAPRIPPKSHLFLLLADAQRMQEVNKL